MYGVRFKQTVIVDVQVAGRGDGLVNFFLLFLLNTKSGFVVIQGQGYVWAKELAFYQFFVMTSFLQFFNSTTFDAVLL